MTNFVIKPGQSFMVNAPAGRKSYGPGQEKQLSEAWQALGSKARKASQYSAAKMGSVIFKNPPVNPESGEVDYEPISWESVTVSAQIDVAPVTQDPANTGQSQEGDQGQPEPVQNPQPEATETAGAGEAVQSEEV